MACLLRARTAPLYGAYERVPAHAIAFASHEAAGRGMRVPRHAGRL